MRNAIHDPSTLCRSRRAGCRSYRATLTFSDCRPADVHNAASNAQTFFRYSLRSAQFPLHGAEKCCRLRRSEYRSRRPVVPSPWRCIQCASRDGHGPRANPSPPSHPLHPMPSRERSRQCFPYRIRPLGPGRSVAIRPDSGAPAFRNSEIC